MSAAGVHLNPEISTWSFLAAHVTATVLNARAPGIGMGGICPSSCATLFCVRSRFRELDPSN